MRDSNTGDGELINRRLEVPLPCSCLWGSGRLEKIRRPRPLGQGVALSGLSQEGLQFLVAVGDDERQ